MAIAPSGRAVQARSAGSSRPSVLDSVYSPSPGDASVALQVDPQHDGNLADDPLTPNGLTQTWSFSQDQETSYPLVVNGRVYFTTYLNGSSPGEHAHVYALTAATGSVVWGPVNIGTYPDDRSSLAYDQGRVFVVDKCGVVSAFDSETGASLWTVALPNQDCYSQDFSAPVALNGTLYVSSGAGTDAISETSGAILWNGWSTGNNSPAVTSTDLFLGGCGGLADLKPINGDSIWGHQPLGCSLAASQSDDLNLSLYNGRLYMNGAIAYAGTGEEQEPFASQVAPAFYGDEGFSAVGDSLVGFDAPTGNTLWTVQASGVFTAPIVVNGTVYAVGGDTLYAVDPTSGHVLSSFPLGSVNGDYQPAGLGAGDGTLVVPASSSIVAFRDPGQPTAPTTTTVSMTSGSEPSSYGDSVTFTATVASSTPPFGSVTFWDGDPSNGNSQDLGAGTISGGQASLTTTDVHAGDRTIYAVYDGDDSHAPSQAQLAHTVNPASLVVTADNQKIWQNGPIPTLTFTASGWLNGDTAGSFTDQPVCATTATQDTNRLETSPPGEYPISCSGALDPDYASAYVSGTLTILASPPASAYWRGVNAGASGGYPGHVTPVSCVMGTTHCVDMASGNDPRSGAVVSRASVTNNGIDWTSYAGPDGMRWTSLSCPTLKVCWTVGYGFTSDGLQTPEIAESRDAGETWSVRTPTSWNVYPVQWRANSISCPTPTTCWVAGSTDGEIYEHPILPGDPRPQHCRTQSGALEPCPAFNPVLSQTTDGGSSWHTVSDLGIVGDSTTFGAALPLPPHATAGGTELTAISCASTALCVAVGGTDPSTFTGTADILSTTDGGQSWYFSGDPTLTGIQELLGVSCSVAGALSPSCHAVGEALNNAGPVVFDSTDGGTSWTGKQFSGLSSPASSISCADELDCWIGAWAGTSDGGSTWNIYAPGFTLWGGPGLGTVTSCSTVSFCVVTAPAPGWNEFGTSQMTAGDGGMGTPLVTPAPTTSLAAPSASEVTAQAQSSVTIVGQDRKPADKLLPGEQLSVEIQLPRGPSSQTQTTVGANDFFATRINHVPIGKTTVTFATAGTRVADFTITGVRGAPPLVSSISPSNGRRRGGNLVTIRGLRLGGVKAVYFGAKRAKRVRFTSSHRVTVQAPPDLGVQDVQVVTRDGGPSQITSRDRYTYRG